LQYIFSKKKQMIRTMDSDSRMVECIRQDSKQILRTEKERGVGGMGQVDVLIVNTRESSLVLFLL
jgi:hypothetical protein